MAALAAAPTPAHPSSGRLSDADEPSASAGSFAPLFTAGTEPYALAPLDELGRPLAAVYVPSRCCSDASAGGRSARPPATASGDPGPRTRAVRASLRARAA